MDNVHPDGLRLCVPGGGCGLAEPTRAVLAGIDHHDPDFCLEALEEVLASHGKPEIFNTDQGSQFTSRAFTQALKDQGIAINMDGKGSWRDNVFVFVERLWRSVKHEEVWCGTSSESSIFARQE